jgi:TM2 domain-containing membrane protein YozV
VIRFLAVLFNLLFVPGAGQIAIGRWRRGIPWLVGFALLPVAALIDPWLVLALIAVVKIGSSIEAGLLRMPRPLGALPALAVYGGALVAALVWF